MLLPQNSHGLSKKNWFLIQISQGQSGKGGLAQKSEDQKLQGQIKMTSSSLSIKIARSNRKCQSAGSKLQVLVDIDEIPLKTC